MNQIRTEMTVREAGRRGGLATKRKHGPEHYERIGRIGGASTKTRMGPEHYERIGGIGGRTAWSKQGKLGRRRRAEKVIEKVREA